MKILYYQKVSSTQDLAHNYAKSGQKEIVTFVSNQQTAGYGKKGRSFYSPADSGIYMSIVLPDFKINLAKANLLTPYIALQVVKVLQKSFADKAFKIKWVNDIYLQRKKVAGILTEIQDRALIIGLGINLNTTNFPNDLQKKAGSITKDTINKKELVLNLANALLIASQQYDKKSFLLEYQRLSILLNKKVTLKVGSKQVTGLVLGFDQNGIVLDINGVRASFSVGEVEKVYF